MWLTVSSCYGWIHLALGLKMRDDGLRTLCQSCWLSGQQRVLKTFPGPGFFHSEDGVVWLWYPLVNLYIWVTVSSCYGSIPLALVLIVRDGGLSTLCHSSGFASQQRVLKTFPGSGYLHSEDGVVLLWLRLVNFYIWLIISSCYGSIPLIWWLIWKDGAFSTLCHSWAFACAQRLLKIFPGPGSLHS